MRMLHHPHASDELLITHQELEQLKAGAELSVAGLRVSMSPEDIVVTRSIWMTEAPKAVRPEGVLGVTYTQDYDNVKLTFDPVTMKLKKVELL